MLSTEPVGSGCTRCGSVAYPAQRRCRACGSWDESEPARLSARGTLVSWSVIHVAPPRPGVQTPYAVGFLDLPEGVRLFTPIDTGDDDPDSVLSIGQEVERAAARGVPFSYGPAGAA